MFWQNDQNENQRQHQHLYQQRQQHQQHHHNQQDQDQELQHNHQHQHQPQQLDLPQRQQRQQHQGQQTRQLQSQTRTRSGPRALDTRSPDLERRGGNQTPYLSPIQVEHVGARPSHQLPLRTRSGPRVLDTRSPSRRRGALTLHLPTSQTDQLGQSSRSSSNRPSLDRDHSHSSIHRIHPYSYPQPLAGQPIDLAQPSPSPRGRSRPRAGPGPSQPRAGTRIHPPPSHQRGLSNPPHLELQFQMPPPPPPADAPAPVSVGVRTDFLSGFQPDYSRVNSDGLRRPVVGIVGENQNGEMAETRARQEEDRRNRLMLRRDEDANDGIVVAGEDENGPPKPGEAYILLRHHRLPRVGWNDGIARDLPEIKDWSYELHVVQQPSRGKALGLQPLPRGWPPLSAPLIVQLIVRDKRGRPVSVDNPALNRRLVHTSMMVDLVSPDGRQNRSVMRIRQQDLASLPEQHEPNTFPSAGDLVQVESQRNLLGSLHRSATPLVLDGNKGIFFIFTELIVRNPGEYTLAVKLLDLAGPSHLGTSIGVTGALATALTQPFTVYHGTTFPGSMPTTDLSTSFTRQGERNLGPVNPKNNAAMPFDDDLGSPSEEPNYPDA